MADLRITALTPAPAPAAVDGARSAAARAAQAAFFQAALGQASSAPSPKTAIAALKSVAAVTPLSTAASSNASERVRFDADAPAPTRPLRPGSLLDIKV